MRCQWAYSLPSAEVSVILAALGDFLSPAVGDSVSFELEALKSRIAKATGQDRDLDRKIAVMLGGVADGQPVPDYTSSVDKCVTLSGSSVLPDWHWHVGHGPRGILPYAELSWHSYANLRHSRHWGLAAMWSLAQRSQHHEH